MVTYNHEHYIADALESVFAQKHEYSFEIVVGDDASTDRTAEIVTEFSIRFPGIIRLIRHPVNIGHYRNYFSVLEASGGEYIALLDGDDYWDDREKLKKQVSFLEAHPDFVLSCHRFRRYFLRDNRYEDDLYPELYDEHPDGFIMDPAKFFTHWVAQTATVVLRRSVVDLSELRAYKYFADVQLFFSVLQKGKGYAHGFFGAVYNMHGDGIWSGLDERQRVLRNLGILGELRARHRHDKNLARAYAVCKHRLLWMEYQSLKSRGGLKVFARASWMGIALLLTDPRWHF
jgi:glycosyltransferase involved in cell wall biosynthesis